MSYQLRNYNKKTQLVRLLSKKDVLEILAKILDKYTNKEFLEIPF